jgi:hypothetical protein
MSIGQNIPGLKDAAGLDITNMNASWTSKWYSLVEFLHLCVQIGWSNMTPTGTLFLDYSADPDGNIFSVKNAITVDGTFDEQMFLDADLAANNYRLRFVRTAGAANLTVFHNYKG